MERVVARIERAMAAVREKPVDQDFYLDSAALNLHDFYAGLERIFQRIAETLDRSLPSGPEWHSELLRQMSMALPSVRPQVLSAETAKSLDEYLRFRHVVRKVYTFEFDPERIGRLVQRLRPVFAGTEAELVAFADFLDQLNRAD